MKQLFNRLGIFVEKKHLLIFIVCLVLIIPSVFGAMLLEMKTGNETFVSTDSEIYQDYDRFNQSFSSDVILVLLEAEDLATLLHPDSMASIETLEDSLNENERIVSAIGPSFAVKQAIVVQGGVPELPDTLAGFQEIVLDPESGQIRTDFLQVIPDNEHAFIAVIPEGGLSREDQEDVIDEVEEAIDAAGFQDIDPVVTGVPVLMKEMTAAQGDSMKNMLILSIGIMLLVLVLIFSVRGFFAWRWLPLGVVLIAIVYAFGAMGVLSIPITMVTMAAFPILIGLGVDYAIQFHNRYDEEARRGETVADAIIDAVTHIGPTIGIAIIAACLGFAALFFSPVPMIQDFGLTLIIGVSACYLLSVLFLLGILYWHDRRAVNKPVSKNKKQKPEKEGAHIVDRALHRLAPWVIKNPVIILPIALVLCVGGIVADEHIETETNVNNFVSQDMQAVKNLNMAEDVLGGVYSMNLFVEAEDVTDPAVLEWIKQVEQQITDSEPDNVFGINSINNIILQGTGGTVPQDAQVIQNILEEVPASIKSNLVTEDHKAANIILNLPELTAEQAEELQERLTEYVAGSPEGVTVIVTGNEVFKIELLDALTSGRMEMTVIGIIMVFVGLFVLFKGRIVRALIAILPIGMILGWSSGIMYLWGIKYTPVTATLGALIIGIGVEFTILLMMRYYEERENGDEPVVAMTTAVTRIGRAVIASGFTVIGGFGALLIAKDFPIIQDFGVVTLINVFFALVSTLLVLPALIVLVDRRRERPKGRKNTKSALPEH